jgi:hypothetical protein
MDCAVWHLAQFGGACAIELATDHVGEADVGWVGGSNPGVAGPAQPKVKVGPEARLADVDTRELVDEDTAANDPLEPRVTPGEVSNAGRNLRIVRRSDGDELQRRRFNVAAAEAAIANGLASPMVGIEPE